ncbi:MAG: Uma2 family endonuclease [Chloroflexi bacterium]|nr:Uma2 family endonuclease [Chloroflexota bacterium]
MTKPRKARETRSAYRAKPRARRVAETRVAAPSAPPIEYHYPEQGQWTYDDWARLPDDGTRYEVIDGELFMTPPPAIAHQYSLDGLLFAMTSFVKARRLGRVISSPVGVRLPAQPVPLEPDIVFVSAARKSIIAEKYIEGVPDLVVEILSPSNWIYDRKEKFQVYRAAGVPEYWIVDYRAKTVEVFVFEKGDYALLGKWGLGETALSRALDGFQVAVAEIFQDID